MTFTQQACIEIAGYEKFHQRVMQKMVINDLSNSAKTNYTRSLALLSLYLKKVPTQLSQEEADDYLYHLKCNGKTASESAFKFTIAAIRFVCRMEHAAPLNLELPSIRKERKLPTVLSKEEATAMMQIPCLLKHRVLIAILYGCGLRCSEVRKLKVLDIDFDRSLLHIRQAKNRKDRFVPLGKKLPAILTRYLHLEKPVDWLFPGVRWGRDKSRFASDFDPQFGQRSIQWAIKRAAKLARIRKHVSVHCLRHTYATHLLESGTNLLTIQRLLGHAHLSTTMIYLHVAQVDNFARCSPLDQLENLHVIGFEQGSFDFPEEEA